MVQLLGWMLLWQLSVAPAAAQTSGAVLTRERKPVYPEGLRKTQKQGNVLLIGRIDKGGTVRDPVVIATSDLGFADPSVAATGREHRYRHRRGRGRRAPPARSGRGKAGPRRSRRRLRCPSSTRSSDRSRRRRTGTRDRRRRQRAGRSHDARRVPHQARDHPGCGDRGRRDQPLAEIPDVLRGDSPSRNRLLHPVVEEERSPVVDHNKR